MSIRKSGETYCGLVALVGRPNVGKSTLLNHLVGQKLSITSRKPQTTRHNLMGVATQGAHQAVFVDTPGLHAHEGRALNRHMVRSAASALHDVDLVVMLLDRDRWHPQDDYVLARVAKARCPRIVVLNKIDRLQDKSTLLPALERIPGDVFDEYFPISALTGEGLEPLRKALFARLPAGPHMFDEEQITDQSERFLVAEIVREKLMRQLGDEIPHRLTVVVEQFKDMPHIADIAADIYVERASQKRIIVGKGGARLKQVGQAAREDIERLLQRRVMLRLWVKVKPGWTDDHMALRRFGYDRFE